MHISYINTLQFKPAGPHIVVNSLCHYNVYDISVSKVVHVTIYDKEFKELYVTDFYDKRGRKIIKDLLLFPLTVEKLRKALNNPDRSVTYSISQGLCIEHSYTGQTSLDEMRNFVYTFLQQFGN